MEEREPVPLISEADYPGFQDLFGADNLPVEYADYLRDLPRTRWHVIKENRREPVTIEIGLETFARRVETLGHAPTLTDLDNLAWELMRQ